MFINFSPDGYLYDKEAILEYIVTKKAEIAKQEKEHAKQLKKEKVSIFKVIFEAINKHNLKNSILFFHIFFILDLYLFYADKKMC